jgi:squalene-hopene/tetraprenyl-beta-curcumene cyclase
MHQHDLGKSLLVLAVGLLIGSGSAYAGEEPGWNPQAAAQYLDGRYAEWAAFKGADRGQGKDKVSCLSCHTSLSYALGRPVLRQVSGDDQPTAQESKQLEQVRSRVAHWGEIDTPRYRLSYDHEEKKKVESWGTEAVLNALVLASDDRRHGLSVPSDSTKQALRNLWATQRKDGVDAGSWDWLDFGLRPWEAGESRFYGSALAAIAVGTAPGYLKGDDDAEARAGVDRLHRFLGSQLEKQNLHNRLFALWASTAIDGLLTAGRRDAIIKEVLAKQQANGGWSLSSLVDCKRQDGTPQETGSDGYATGLAVHVLQLAGVRRDQPPVARGLAWLRANQQQDGHWIASSLNKRRDPKTHVGKFMSDSATTFAVLALRPR